MIPFHEAFNQFIKGQVITEFCSVQPFGDHNKPHGERFYGEGIICANGYKILHYGGGCSGEDCNTTYIVDDHDNLIASDNW